MDSYRLPRHVVPTRYDLRIEPDLKTGAFAGEETVTLTVQEPTGELLLNAAELEVVQAAIRATEASPIAEPLCSTRRRSGAGSVSPSRSRPARGACVWLSQVR